MARVLILGANSAIAAEVARLCAARGDGLYLVGRDAQKLAALRAELAPAVLGVEAADLADTQGSAGVVDRALFAMGGVDLALVAHGLLGDQEKSEHEWAEAERVLTTNYLSAVSLLIPLANALESQQSGVLAVITSVAGDRGRPRNYTYGSAKGALNIYLQGVRSRLYRAGVRVYAIRLGPVETPMTATPPQERALRPAAADCRAASCARSRGAGRTSTCPGSGGRSWPWCATFPSRCSSASGSSRGVNRTVKLHCGIDGGIPSADSSSLAMRKAWSRSITLRKYTLPGSWSRPLASGPRLSGAKPQSRTSLSTTDAAPWLSVGNTTATGAWLSARPRSSSALMVSEGLRHRELGHQPRHLFARGVDARGTVPPTGWCQSTRIPGVVQALKHAP